MTTFTVSTDELEALRRLSESRLRAPTEVTGYPSGDEWTVTYDPDLTTEEADLLQRLRSLIRSAVQVTPDEWDALLPVLVSIRTHRTRTSTEWSAMTAAQRDTALIDWNRNLTDVLRALLRD